MIVVRKKKLPAAALGGGHKSSGLPGSDNKLATRRKNTSLNKRK